MSVLLELLEVARKIAKLWHELAPDSVRLALHASENRLQLLVPLVVKSWSLPREARIRLLLQLNALLINQFPKQTPLFFLAKILFNDRL